MCTWAIIEENPNYSVSDTGLILNNRSGRLKIKKIDTKGYEAVDLYRDGESKTFRVHRLVAKYFVDGYDERLTVNHIDGNKRNNCATNLEMLTLADNIRHAWNVGLMKPHYGVRTMLGRKNPNVALSRRRSVMVVETGEIFDSIKECREATGATHINDVLNGTQQTSGGLSFVYVEKV